MQHVIPSCLYKHNTEFIQWFWMVVFSKATSCWSDIKLNTNLFVCKYYAYLCWNIKRVYHFSVDLKTLILVSTWILEFHLLTIVWNITVFARNFRCNLPAKAQVFHHVFDGVDQNGDILKLQTTATEKNNKKSWIHILIICQR